MTGKTMATSPENNPENRRHDPVRLDELLSHEDEFRQRYPWIWRATLFGPMILTAVLLLTLVVVAGWGFASRLVASTALALWLLGRFIILSGSDGALQNFEGGLSAFQLFILLSYLDAMVALVLAFHIGFLFRLPIIGPRVGALVTDGHFILDSHPWMRRTTYLGLIAFVGFPLAATGSVGGSVFGRLLGLSRLATFACTLIGSVLGNGLMFWFSDVLGTWIDKDNPLIKYGGLLLVLLLVVLLERRYQYLKKQFVEEVQKPAEN